MAKTRKQRGGICPCSFKGGASSCTLNKMGGSRSSTRRGASACNFNKMGGSRSSTRRGASACNFNKMGGSRSSLKGGGSCSPLIRGGGADSGMFVKVGGYLSSLIGGGCSCSGSKVNPLTAVYGGYRPTKKNRNLVKRYKQGKSIGFTARSSLKAKGLIRRSNGTYKVSPKYLRK